VAKVVNHDAFAAFFDHTALKVDRAQIVQAVNTSQFANKILTFAHFIAGAGELFCNSLCAVVEQVLWLLVGLGLVVTLLGDFVLI
jgi:hypothetical protein